MMNGLSAVPTIGAVIRRGPQIGVRVALGIRDAQPVYIAEKQGHADSSTCCCSGCDSDTPVWTTPNQDEAQCFRDRDSALQASVRMERQDPLATVWLEPVYAGRMQSLGLSSGR